MRIHRIEVSNLVFRRARRKQAGSTFLTEMLGYLKSWFILTFLLGITWCVDDLIIFRLFHYIRRQIMS